MKNYTLSIIILLILCFGCYSKKQYINEKKETVVEKERRIKFSKYGKVIINTTYKDSIGNKTEFTKKVYYLKTPYRKTIFYVNKKYKNRILDEKSVILENGDSYLYKYNNGKLVSKERQNKVLIKGKN